MENSLVPNNAENDSAAPSEKRLSELSQLFQDEAAVVQSCEHRGFIQSCIDVVCESYDITCPPVSRFWIAYELASEETTRGEIRRRTKQLLSAPGFAEQKRYQQILVPADFSRDRFETEKPITYGTPEYEAHIQRQMEIK